MSMWNSDRIWLSSWSKDDGSIYLKHPLSLKKKKQVQQALWKTFPYSSDATRVASNMNQTHRQCWINWPRRNKCHAIGLQDGIHIGFPVIPQLLSYDTSVAKPTHGAFLKASMCGFFVEKMPFSSRSWRMISKNPIPISIYTVNGNVYIYIHIISISDSFFQWQQIIQNHRCEAQDMFSYPRSPIHPPFAPGSLRCWMMWRYYWHASNFMDQGDMTQIFKFPHKNTKKTLLANNHLCIHLAKATTRKLNHPMEAVKLLAIRPSWAKGRTWRIPKESIFKMPMGLLRSQIELDV